MKSKWKLVIAGITTALLIGGCGAKTAEQPAAAAAPAPAASTAVSQEKAAPEEVTIKVLADITPHAEILEHIKPALKEQGVNLEILTDVAQQNEAVRDKEADANYFQHLPYLESIAEEIKFDYAVLASVHVEPIGFYSTKIKSIEELKDGAKILITNDPSNEYRMLVLLESKGLIKLKEGISDYRATPKDIVENPKNLEFIEVDAGLLTRNLPEVDGAIINTNRVLEAKIDPNTALFREDAKSPYANLVIVRKGEENRPELQKLKEALLTEDVKKFITEKYGVAVVPVF
ncbi:MAG: ABC-type metal ion transport system, periplasmic component/surface antigen [Clostridia bacterium]|nr:ABC-type metal ion transport system, periplasmic component/surface antigen [Clostridia bacterium]